MNKNSIIKKIATLTLAASLFSFTGGSNIIDFNAGASNVITVSASASGTGTYMVNTSAGLNVRSSASSSGSKDGAAANGVKFNVTKISGNWGFTPAIQTTSGTKSGWVCLDYCKKLNNWASISDGTYAVKPQCAPNSCLDVEACGTSNGANIHLWEYFGNANQKVNLRNNGNGTVSLYFTHCNKAVDISGGNSGNGINCQLWDPNGTPAQQYYLFDEGNGYYSLHLASNTNYVLDISGCSSINGTNCHLWTYNGTPAQKFKFETVNNTSSVSQTNLSYGLYKNSNARITCGFDGYVNTKGRHEGIDINCSLGAPVYSLTDGVITNVVYGKEGSSGLSTIAIYNEKTNKTVVYLHSAPISGLSVGKAIKKGDKIASESWRGISSSSGRHTHIEVRDGKKTCAAKSVNDYTLDNPNPTSFWNSQGYRIK